MAYLEHTRPLVKICGLSRSRDVALAAELGAWAVGFVFVPSPRWVTVEAARKVVAEARASFSADRSFPLAVGVFGDVSAVEIAEVVGEADLDAVQLHGARPDASAARELLRSGGSPALIIRAIPVEECATPAGVRAAVEASGEGADLLLFDTRLNGRWGGTGTTFPWELARRAAGDRPFLVAGGIGPRNAAEALRTSGAWGIDVSSGVEQTPGIKDEAQMRALFAAATAPGQARDAHAAAAAESQARPKGTTT